VWRWGDEESGNHEEHIDSREAARNRRRERVVQNDRDHSDSTKAVNVRTIDDGGMQSRFHTNGLIKRLSATPEIVANL
jgi:hypothetical protein